VVRILSNSEFRIGIEAKILKSSIDQIKQQLKQIETEVNKNLSFKVNNQNFKDVDKNLNNIKTQLNQMGTFDDSGIIKMSTKITTAANGTELLERNMIKAKQAMGEYLVETEKINKTTGKTLYDTEVIIDNNEKLKLIEKERNKINTSIEQRMGNQVNLIDLQIKKREQEGKQFSSLLKKQMQSTVELQNKLNLYKQKMLGGDGFSGEIDIFMSKNKGNINKDAERALEKIKTDINELNVSTPDLNNKMKQLGIRFSSIKQESAQAGTVMTRMFENLVKFLRFYLVAGTFVKLISELKKGIDTVKDLDAAITNMKITMNLTDSEFDRMTVSSQKLAKELGSTVKEVLGAAKTFANMNESIDAILEKTRANIILSNLSGSGIDETVDAIQGIMNQFELLEKDSMRIADTLTFISANLAMDFSKGIREITDGIKNSGSMAKEAGFELEQYESMLGKVIEQTRLGGSTVSAGMRTIFARLGRVTDSEAASDEDISKAEEAFRSVGVALRDLNGEFRKTPEVLEELNVVWGTLDNVQRSFIAEQAAGVRQKNIFLSMMNSFSESTNLYTQALEANGFAMERNKIFMESIAGRTKRLAATFETFWQNAISTDTVKDFISLLTGIGETLNFIVSNPMASFIAQASLMTVGVILLGKGFSTLGIKFVAYISGLKVAEIATLGFSGAVKALTASLLISPLFKAAVVVVGIYAIVKVIDKLTISSSELKESFDKTTQSIEDEKKEIDNLKQSYIDLSEKVKTDDSVKINLIETERKLRNLIGETKEQIDLQNGSLEKNIELIDEAIKAKDEEFLLLEKRNFERADKALTEKKERGDLTYEWMTSKPMELKEYVGYTRNQMAALLEKDDVFSRGRYEIFRLEYLKAKEHLDNYEEIVNKYMEVQERVNLRNRSPILTDTITPPTEGTGKTTKTIEASAKVFEEEYELNEYYRDLRDDDIKSTKEYYEKLNDLFNQHWSDLDGDRRRAIKIELENLRRELHPRETIDFYKTLAESDEGYLGLYLESLLEKQTVVFKDFVNMSDEQLSKLFKTSGKDIQDKILEFYNLKDTITKIEIDISKRNTELFKLTYDTLNFKRDVKILTDEEYYNQLLKLYQEYKDSLSLEEQRKAEVELFNLGEKIHSTLPDTTAYYSTKIKALKELLDVDKISLQYYYDELLKLREQYFSEYSGKSSEELMQLAESPDEAISKSVSNYLTLEKEILSMETELNKEIQHGVVDRYTELNNVLAKVNVELALNQSLQETASHEEKLKLMEEEEKLLKDKQKVLRNLADEQRAQINEEVEFLKKQGFDIIGKDENVQIVNGLDTLKTLGGKLSAEEYNKIKESYDDVFDLIENIFKEKADYITIDKQIVDIFTEFSDMALQQLEDNLNKTTDSFIPLNKELEELDYKMALLGKNDLSGQFMITRDKAEILRKIVAKLESDIINLNDTTSETDKATDVFKDSMDNLTLQLKNSRIELYNITQALNDFYQKIKDARIEIENEIISALEDKYQEQIDKYKDLVAKQKDLYSEDYQNKKEAIENKYDLEIDNLNKLKDLHKAEIEEQKFQENKAKIQEKINNLEKRYNILIKDRSGNAKEIYDLEQDLIEERKSLQNLEFDRLINSTETNINAQIDLLQKEKNKELEIEENVYKQQIDELETTLESQKEMVLQYQNDIVKEGYKQYIKAKRNLLDIVGETESIISGSQGDILTFLTDNVAAFKEATNLQGQAMLDSWKVKLGLIKAEHLGTQVAILDAFDTTVSDLRSNASEMVLAGNEAAAKYFTTLADEVEEIASNPDATYQEKIAKIAMLFQLAIPYLKEAGVSNASEFLINLTNRLLNPTQQDKTNIKNANRSIIDTFDKYQKDYKTVGQTQGEAIVDGIAQAIDDGKTKVEGKITSLIDKYKDIPSVEAELSEEGKKLANQLDYNANRSLSYPEVGLLSEEQPQKEKQKTKKESIPPIDKAKSLLDSMLSDYPEFESSSVYKEGIADWINKVKKGEWDYNKFSTSINNLASAIKTNRNYVSYNDEDYYGYSKGGLVKDTGFYKIHGTEKKPEAVLDPDSTKSFIKMGKLTPEIVPMLENLRNIFSSNFLTPKIALAGNNNGASFNIENINVEVNKIDNDLDIKDTARKIGDELYNEMQWAGSTVNIRRR